MWQYTSLINMIYDDYIEYAEVYRKKYGDKTLVLLQVGDFFEIYAVQTEVEKVGADIYVIGDLCNLQVTRKNKSILENSRQNPLMAGFPLHAVTKNTQILLQHGYTIVIIRQVTPPPNVQREVTEILSPSTNPQPNGMDSHYLFVFLWEEYKSKNGTLVAFGLAGVDVSTGHTFVCESGSTLDDPTFAIDEAYRLWQTYQPKETVLLGNIQPTYRQQIESWLCRTVHKVWDQMPKEITSIRHQNETFTKVFTVDSMLSPIEHLNLETYCLANGAFMYQLLFLQEHNDLMMKKLQPPIREGRSTYLTLEYNSIVQLNVIGTNQSDRPLLHFLNRCNTAFGSRRFRDRLLHPITEPKELQARYDKVQYYLEENRFVTVSKLLSQVLDLERLKRRLDMGTLSPLEWCNLEQALQVGLHIWKDREDLMTSIRYIQQQYKVLHLEECAKYTLTDIRANVFCQGYCKTLDSYQDMLVKHLDALSRLAEAISMSGDGDNCLCKLDSNERDGYFLTMTKRRYDAAMKLSKILNVVGVDINMLDELQVKPISSGSTTLRLSHKWIESTSDAIHELYRKMNIESTQAYKSFLQEVSSKLDEPLKVIIDAFADVDIYTTCAKNAYEYGYSRPMFDPSKEVGMQFTAIRHPIIERLQQDVDYVPNDVALGPKYQKHGMLLYGINASGKSSLMKAIGLNVIMAQAGMYVAASSMTYTPYVHLFTRISGQDNIYRGQSSFTVEMSELRNILQRADGMSLVLGDELCAGTESMSALAIVAAGIESLANRQASFVFATHLHELTDIPCIQKREDLEIAHMHIGMHPETGKIVYERKLQPGKGSALYGLEVCMALQMPKEFLQTAQQVRRWIQKVPNTLVNTKRSRYNAKVAMNTCRVCENPATETHHIRYQQDANDDGFVEKGVHKHRASNLVPLCESCHQKEHKGLLRISGYKKTSEGVQLMFEHVSTN